MSRPAIRAHPALAAGDFDRADAPQPPGELPELSRSFHAAADVGNKRVVVTVSGVTMAISFEAAEPLESRMFKGSKEPMLGWYGEGCGKLRLAPAVVLSLRAALPQTLVSRLRLGAPGS